MTRRQANPKTLIGAMAVSLALLATPERAAASPYKLTVFDQGTSMYNAKLNNAGQVGGYFTPLKYWDKGEHVFFYDSNPGGQVAVSGITLPTDSHPGSYDFYVGFESINGQGQALGYRSDTGKTAIFDTRTGAASSLPAAWDLQRKTNVQITDSGAVYGRLYSREPNGHFRYQPIVYRDGAIHHLDIPPGMEGAYLIAADDAGRLLVRAAPLTDGMPNYDAHTLLLDNGRWNDLGDLVVGSGRDGPVMNASGDVVGSVGDFGQNSVHAAFVPNSGEVIDLGALPGRNYSQGAAINSAGSIVGFSYNTTTRNNLAGFLYQNGVMSDLNDLIEAGDGWLITGASSINDRGQILATAYKRDLGLGYLLLTPGDQPTPPDFLLPELPVPEPSTWVVFALAAVGLGWRGVRGRGRGRISRGR